MTCAKGFLYGPTSKQRSAMTANPMASTRVSKGSVALKGLSKAGHELVTWTLGPGVVFGSLIEYVFSILLVVGSYEKLSGKLKLGGLLPQ